MKDFKFTYKEIQEMWKRPYERQINIVYAKILEAINITEGNVALSFSGGADSGMMLWMTCQTWQQIYGNSRPLTVIFANTTNEFLTMHTHVKSFVELCEKTFEIKINLEVACAGKSFKDVVVNFGFPFVAKKTARMINDVRVALKNLNLTYSDIEPYVKFRSVECANKLRKMGFSNTAVCNLTGIKSDNQNGTCYIARKWLPLIYAPWDTSHFCCSHLKKQPIKAMEKKLGKMQPMIGEMASDSKNRLDAYRHTGCNMFDSKGRGVSKPLGAITGETVRRWYYENPQVPLAPPYGQIIKTDNDYAYTGEQRTGCKLCAFGIQFDWERFARLAEIEPETVKSAFKPVKEGGLGYKEKCEYLNEHCKCKIVIPEITYSV